MKYVIMPVLGLLNLAFACVCFAMCWPLLFLWHLRFAKATDASGNVFVGILEFDAEVYVPAAIFAFIFSPFWLLLPIIHIYHYFN